MVYTYNPKEMVVYEERLVFLAFRERGPKDMMNEEPHQLSDSQKSVKSHMEEIQHWTSEDVPEEYEYRKPFLPWHVIKNLPWEMRLMHDWYMQASRKGLRSLV